MADGHEPRLCDGARVIGCHTEKKCENDIHPQYVYFADVEQLSLEASGKITAKMGHVAEDDGGR